MSLAIDYLYIPPVHEVFASNDATQRFYVAVILALGTGVLSSSFRTAFRRMALAKEEAELAKQEAETAVRSRDETVGVISHELKNPLMALQMGVALIQKTFPKAPENANVLKLIERLTPSIQRMGRLVSDLLDVTRLEARALRLEPRHSNLREILGEICRSFEAAAAEKLVELRVVDISSEAGEVVCDPMRTHQVLSNLVGNAIKFSDEGGSVSISATRVNGHIEIRVADTGKGIPKEHLPHVFDRFWQAKETAYKGTGLGLAIAKGLVEAQGGRIWVESSVGEGSVFFFTLPAASVARAPIQQNA